MTNELANSPAEQGKDVTVSPERVLPRAAAEDGNAPAASQIDGVVSPVEEAGRSEGTSLRLRLLQTVLPAVLVPLLLAGGLGYRIVQGRSQERIQEQLQNQALLTSESTAEVLDNLLIFPRTVAASPLVINEAVAGGAQAESEGLDQLPAQELEEKFSGSRFLRTHNRLNSYLQETVESAGLSEILITDSHGFNVAASDVPTDFVQSDEDWWEQGSQLGQWIGSPDFDYAAKNYTVEIAQRIDDPVTGSFVGMVRAVLPTRKFSLLSQYIQRTGIAGSQRVQIVDGSRQKVIDTISPQGFRKSNDIIGGQPVGQLASVLAEATQRSFDPAGLRQELRQASQLRGLDLAFSDKRTAVATFLHQGRQYKMANIPGTTWVAIASMDRAEISAQGRDSLALIGLTTLALAGATAALLIWFSRQLTDPLAVLANQARQVAGGDFDTLVAPQGTQETRTLTRSFNQLVVQVKQLLARQRAETQKAQLFAAITSTPATVEEDIALILAQTLPEARELLRADRLVFYPWGPQSRRVLASEAQAPTLNPAAFSAALPPEAVAERWLAPSPERAVMAIEDIQAGQWPPSWRNYLSVLGAASVLSVPIFSENRLYGFLSAYRQTAGPWELEAQSLIAQLADHLSLVVERISAVRSIRESRQAAQESQQAAQESQQMAASLSAENREQSLAQARAKEQLQQQVAQLSRDIQGVAQGDLTVRAQGGGGDLQTVAEVFNLTVAGLQSLVNQVKAASRQINQVLVQNVQTAHQLTDSSGTQAQDARLTLERVQAMKEALGAIAESAEAASTAADQATTTIAAGSSSIAQTAERILHLSQVCTEATSQIEGFGRSAEHINQSTALIREIARELGQLSRRPEPALAPDESQRWLEQVTTRLGKLAQQTLDETTLLDTFLKSLQQKSNQMVISLAGIQEEVTQSNQLIQSSRQTFTDVAEASEQFDQLAGSIATATSSQREITQSVTELVGDMVELSQQTQRFSQQMEEALRQTVATAQTLNESVARFQV